ncbi:hypothetical protein GCM10007108_15290 [Thermogymnomonas acidicola]|uniref:CAAX prenyl protease 2/Lysostaphin resistance protein A-like domain-containing protein n=1 Tax=Thermogymnomonas acidicola TaxID=399579 RepID=A0AA37F9W8_9ARCH|nr:hypothetical protein GCM10007108_15290 [Thermogymnomonas acidicola]
MRDPLIFASTEAVQVSLFYLLLGRPSELTYLLYLLITPLFFVLCFIYVRDVRENLRGAFLNNWIWLLVAVIIVFVFAYIADRQPVSFIFSTAYYPVLIEDLNFRYIFPVYLGRRVGMGRAIVIQSIVYTVFYLSAVVMQPGAYPGAYSVLFVLDMFATGIFYGGLYYLKRNPYPAICAHLALYLMIPFVPASGGWFPYVVVPM